MHGHLYREVLSAVLLLACVGTHVVECGLVKVGAQDDIRAGLVTLPDISFNNTFGTGQTLWTLDNKSMNLTSATNTLCIQGDNKTYLRATLSIPISAAWWSPRHRVQASVPVPVLPKTRKFYFIVDAQLSGIVAGPEQFDLPKLKVTGNSSGKTEANNLRQVCRLS